MEGASLSQRRGRPSAEDLPARKALLVAIAAEVFSRDGYDQATFATIARAANVSVKTIYSWFGGKIGLFRAVTEDFGGRIEPACRAVMDEVGEDPHVALPRMAEIMLHFVLSPEFLNFQRAVVAASVETPAVGGEFNRNGPLRGHRVLAEFFDRWTRERKLAIVDRDQAIDVFSGLVFGDVMRSQIIDSTLPPLTPEDAAVRARERAGLFLRLFAINRA